MGGTDKRELSQTTLERALRPLIVLLALLTLVLVGSFAAGRAVAQGTDIDLPPGITLDDVNAIARKMSCDVCEGVPLDECESVACRQWRQEIARQLGEGRTQGEIMDYFVERYGADVASLPRDGTDRAIAFGVPIALVALIAVVGGVQMLNLRRRGQQAGQVVRRSGERLSSRPVPDDLDPALLERLQRELEGLDP